jgi:adenosylhomocysteine nucleosidase
VETIGLLSAMSQESAALLRYIKGWKHIDICGYRGSRFQINNRDCVLVTTGMGYSRAANGACALLEIINPDLLISFGIAGAVKDDLNIGDVVIAGSTCMLENDHPGPPLPLASISREAREAVLQILQPVGASLISGTAITTRGSQLIQKEWPGITNPILEMETVGIAQAAHEKKIPLLSIRSISDGPRSPIPFDLEAVLDENNDIAVGKLLRLVLHRPRILFQSRRMVRNSQIASDHVARALLSMLKQPSSLISS